MGFLGDSGESLGRNCSDCAQAELEVHSRSWR